MAQVYGSQPGALMSQTCALPWAPLQLEWTHGVETFSKECGADHFRALKSHTFLAKELIFKLIEFLVKGSETTVGKPWGHSAIKKEIVRQPWENHGETTGPILGKTLEKHGKTIGETLGKFWENHAKTVGKLFENHGKTVREIVRKFGKKTWSNRGTMWQLRENHWGN